MVDGPDKTTIYFQDKPPVVNFLWVREPEAVKYRVRVYREGELSKAVAERTVNESSLALPEGTLAEGRLPSREDARYLQKIASQHAATPSGDRAEFAGVPESAAVWHHVTSTRENCLGQECPHHKDCYVLSARRDALAADVVVVNHHLFFADIMLKDEGMAELLPSCNTVILDEAHNASGGESTTGYFIRERLLANAQGCCYLSATFAKRPDNMPVYAKKTAISHANIKATELEEVFARGGVALQEIVAGELVASGQMLRRQRSFEGIRVEYNFLPDDYEEHRVIYNTVIGLVNDIIAFEQEVIEPYLETMSKALSSGGEKAEKRKGTEKGGVSNSPFFNKTHNVIRQLLFSIKARQVAREAIRLLGENKKVVIAFANTMASFMDEFGYTNGDEVDNLDFAMVLNRSLENALKYTVATDTGEITRAVRGRGVGFTPSPRDHHEVAQALADLVELGPEGRRAMGERGRRMAAAEFDQHLVTRRIEQTYHDLLVRRPWAAPAVTARRPPDADPDQAAQSAILANR